MSNELLEVRLRTMLRERARDVDATDTAGFEATSAAANDAYSTATEIELQPVSEHPRRTWTAAMAAAAAIVLLICLAVAVVHPHVGGPTAATIDGAVKGNALDTPAGGNAACQSSPDGTPAGWSRLRATGSTFSLEYVMLKSTDTVVHVTRVVPVGVRGSITLEHATFIPVGGTGNGMPWSEAGQDVPVQWTMRRPIPGDLSYEPDYTLIPNRPPSANGSMFELVVGVTSGAQGGSVDHMRVFYTAGGRNYYVDVQGSFAMYPTMAQCSNWDPAFGH